MAISTYKIFLMKKASTGSTYEKLLDIKSFPDLGGAPELLETTTLSDGAKTYIPGIQSQSAMEFGANYTKSDYIKLKALKDTEAEYAVWFGGTESGGVVTPTGSEGKFSFKGILDVWVVGAGTNAVTDMKISIVPSTVISYDGSTAN